MDGMRFILIVVRALGFNLTTKQEGSFPLACVGPFNNGQAGAGKAKIGNRNSSLYLPSEAPSMFSKRYDNDDMYDDDDDDESEYESEY
jgi:hypothetical protein